MARTGWGGGQRDGARTDLGSNRLGKYSLKVATWEKSFGKVPNILAYGKR